jgi:diacylglycerol kinase (ATP)
MDSLREALRRHNVGGQIVESDSPEHFQSAVRGAIGDGCTKLIAMGGDGSLQMLVREVLGGPGQVGIIPAGGGNDFAATLGIPRNIDEAVEVIARGKSRKVDVIEAKFSDGAWRIYLGGGGMGLDAEAARLSNGRFKSWPGRLRYLASAIAALRGFAGIEAEIQFPGEESARINRRLLLAAALNTPAYGGGLKLAPEARLDDGELEVVMLEMLGTWEVLKLIPRLLTSGELKTQRVHRVRAKRVAFSAKGSSWFQGDGELLGTVPVELAVLPSAVEILVP